ncbi:MAG: mannosyltransferase family protein, partial [Acidimicrobiales bacterium]
MTSGTATVRAEGGATQAWREWVPPLAVYAAVLAVLLVVSWQTVVHFEEDARVGAVVFPGSWFFEGWMRWDGGWYWGIADLGYAYTPGTQSSVAFFPGYPFAMRLFGRPIDNIPLAGIAITIMSGMLAAVLFWRWCRARLSRSAAVTALLLLAVYPYGWYLYGAIYGDALFLAASLSAFLLLERDHPVLA